MPGKLHLVINTPTEEKVNIQTDMVIMRTVTGDMGILPGHEPASAALDLGVLRIFNDGEEKKMALLGGIAKVERDTLNIVANNAEWPEELDHARAIATRDDFQERMLTSADDLEIQSNQVQLRRALVRIEVSSYSVLSKT